MEFLLVEDDAAIALGLKHLLKHEGYELSVAKSVSEAKALISERSFSLILLDITLPDGLGYDVCTHVRETLHQQTPIIFLTACDEEVNVILGLELGGDDYVTKPFRAKELVARIKTVLRRHQVSVQHTELTVEDKPLILGELKVYPTQAKVYKRETELYLSTIEYKLFLFLIKNQQQILPRELILERVFDSEGQFINDNTLSVYMKRLREKIEDDPQHPNYLHTMRGLGYKVEVVA